MGKLSKYFLDNIFRINGCFLLMTLIYGVRPLSRGIIHALMYYDPDKQLLLLSIVDGLLMLIIIDYSIRSGIHVNKLRLCCDLVYFGSGVIMNYVLKQLSTLSDN